MPTTEQLTNFIHKLHYRSFDKVWEHVHEKYGDEVTEQQVRDILAEFIKDPSKYELRQQRQYYHKAFSQHPHAWMMDLLDNSGQTPDYNNKAEAEAKEMTKETPLYWFIFININTRYVAAYPIYHKTTATILDVLRRFVSEHKCVSLKSDKESAFIADETTNFLKSQNVSQYIVTDNNHTSLTLIDSFIRHLRDLNTTNEKSKYQSHHSKYRNFSTHRMDELIETYNNTKHTATNMKPVDMQNDIKLERQYIARCLIHESKKRNHTVPNGHFVRIVLTKDNMKKRRFKVSRECYRITGRDGKNYIVSAADNTTLTLPRHRLIDLGEEQGKYKLADTIPEGSRIPTAIINRQGASYLVAYGDDGAGEMRKVDLRRHHPQVKSKLEKEFEQS